MTPTVFAHSPWNGTYSCEYDAGSTAPGTHAVIHHNLVIKETRCRLDIEGYQANEKIICTAKSDKNILAVTFKSYENGTVSNLYGVQVYDQKHPLFSLENTNGSLKTHWQSLHQEENSGLATQCFTRQNKK